MATTVGVEATQVEPLQFGSVEFPVDIAASLRRRPSVIRVEGQPEVLIGGLQPARVGVLELEDRGARDHGQVGELDPVSPTASV